MSQTTNNNSSNIPQGDTTPVMPQPPAPVPSNPPVPE